MSFPVLIHDFIDFLKTLFYYFLTFGTCYYNLARYKNKKGHFWVLHSIYEPRKNFGFILDFIFTNDHWLISVRHFIIGKLKFIQMDRKFNIRRGNNILNFYFTISAWILVPDYLIDYFGILATRQCAI